MTIFLYDNFQIFPITLVNITNIWSHRLILFCYCSALYSSNVSKSMLLYGKIIRLNYLILLPLKISWSAKLVPYIVTKSFSATKRQVWDQFIALNLAKSYCIKKTIIKLKKKKKTCNYGLFGLKRTINITPVLKPLPNAGQGECCWG